MLHLRGAEHNFTALLLYFNGSSLGGRKKMTKRVRETPSVNDEIAYVKSRKKTLFPPIKHVCSHKFCNPETFGNLNVYVCDYGQVHRCSDQNCDSYIINERDERICSISGLVLEAQTEYLTHSFNNDPHWCIQKEKPTKKRSTLKERVLKQAEEMVTKLLFGNARKEINGNITSDSEKKAIQMINKHVQECVQKHQYVKFPNIMRIISDAYTKTPFYSIYKVDPEIISNIVGIIGSVWDKLIIPFYDPTLNIYSMIPDAPMRPNIESMNLGILYMMRDGHSIQGTVYIPYHSFVAFNIPREKDLKTFDVEIGRIKPAKDLLIKFYEKAIKMNMSVFVDQYEISKRKEEENNPVDDDDDDYFMPSSRGIMCSKCNTRHLQSSLCYSY